MKLLSLIGACPQIIKEAILNNEFKKHLEAEIIDGTLISVQYHVL